MLDQRGARAAFDALFLGKLSWHQRLILEHVEQAMKDGRRLLIVGGRTSGRRYIEQILGHEQKPKVELPPRVPLPELPWRTRTITKLGCRIRWNDRTSEMVDTPPYTVF